MLKIKKIIKKVAASLMAVTMTATILPTQVFAADTTTTGAHVTQREYAEKDARNPNFIKYRYKQYRYGDAGHRNYFDTTHTQDFVFWFQKDGKNAFCLDGALEDWIYYESKGNIRAGMDTLAKMYFYIIKDKYYNYDYDSDKYFLMANCCWFMYPENMGAYQGNKTWVQLPDYGINSESDMQDYYNAAYNWATQNCPLDKLPSFDGQTIYGASVQDTNGVVDGNWYYNISSVSGGTASIDEASHTLSVVPTSADGKVTVTLTQYLPSELRADDKYTSTSLFHPTQVPQGDYKQEVGLFVLTPKTSTVTFYANKTVNLSLEKESANKEMTDGNSCYSLENAVFEIYDGSNNKLGEIITDENGKGNISLTIPFNVDTLYYKETVAPAGYNPIEGLQPISIPAKNTSDVLVNVKEVPGNDPIAIIIDKKSEDGDIVTNVPSLAGAKFQIDYYAAQYATVNDLPDTPTRTWVVKTDEYGMAGLTKSYVIPEESDDFYLNSDKNPVLPLGTITVQEIEAPANGKYTLKNKFAVGTKSDFENGTSSTVEATAEGKVLFNIDKTPGEGFGVTAGNYLTVKDTASRTGSVKVQKYDSQTGKSTQGDATNLTTVIDVINNNDYGVVARDENGKDIGAAENRGDVVYTITTDENGYWESAHGFLPVGNYIFREVTAPTGYTLNGATETAVAVTEDGVKIDLTNREFNDEVIRGGFSIQKYDEITGTRPQGDTDLSTSFKVVNKSENAIVYNGTVYNVGDTIFEFTTDKTGRYDSEEKILPYGTYEIVETVAPEGYTLEGTTSATFSIREENEIVDLDYEGDFNNKIIENQTVSNVIADISKDGDFTIHKAQMSGTTSSSWATPEEGAQFAVVLKRYVTPTGEDGEITPDDVRRAYEARETANVTDGAGNPQVGYTDMEWDLLTTDKDGNAKSKKLAYGEYVIAQIATASDELTMVPNVTEFTVAQAHQETVSYEAINGKQQYSLRLYKIDSVTGKAVTLNSATFKVKDLSTGKYVEQKVGSKTYSSFKTVSKNAATEKVPAGTFYADEEAEGSAVLPLKLDAGKYQIEEVVNSSSNTNTTPAGYFTMEPITVEIMANSLNRVEDDADGDRVIAVEAKNAPISGEVSITKTIEDYDSDMSLIDRRDLSGFGFTLYAAEDIIDPADGSVIVKAGETAKHYTTRSEVGEIFVDETGDAIIKDLPLGEYILKETTQPSGTVLNDKEYKVSLKQKEDGTIFGLFNKFLVSDKDEYENEVVSVHFDIENKTTKLNVEKKDVAGNELPGAQMSVTTEDGLVIDEWTSTENGHKIEGLEVGKTYILNEIVAPNGYVKASSIKFTVNSEGIETTETMIDKIVSISKVDVAGSEIEGAQMSVTDEDGNVVDQWTSDGTEHKVNGLEVGKSYVIHEVVAPEGYVKATDIPFTVTDEGVDQHYDVVDKIVSVSKLDVAGSEVFGAKMSVTDEDGNIIDEWTSNGKEHKINGLEVGKSYVIHEDVAPAGYAVANDIPFTVTEEGIDQHYDVIDKTVSISKVNVAGDEIEGAEMSVTDEDGNVIDEWTSNGKEHKVSGLEVGKTYVIHENVAPAGYAVVNDIPFTVTEEGVNQHINVVDTKVTVSKEDQGGKELPGAHITVTDEDGNVVDEWTSTDTPHDIEGIEEGKTYTITETAAPDGYYYAESAEFTVNGEEDQLITMIDNVIHYQIAKVDDNGNYVAGVTLKLTDITDAENPVEIELPNNGVTTDTPFDLEGKLIADHKYNLEESEYVEGVYQATNIEFTVAHEGTAEITTITMLDETTNISVSKVDETGKPVEGAKLSILDSEGNVIYEFTSENKPTDISEYVKGGETYTLREDESPFGFEKSEDITFTVTGKKESHQVIVMQDVRKHVYISALKIDAETKKPLADAELTLFDKDGNIMKDVNGKECKALSNKDGLVSWEIAYPGQKAGLYILETKAPEGYNLNETKFKIEIKDNYSFEKDDVIKVTIEDDEESDTGVSSTTAAFAGLALASLIGLGLTEKKKKNAK